MKTKVNTLDLWNSIHNDWALNRIDATIKFIDPDDMIGNVGDIGEWNPAAEIIEKHFNNIIVPLDFNFNYPFVFNKDNKTKFDTILCLECLEHTYNPLTLLESIYKLLKDNGVLYLSIPRAWPQFLKDKHHFHEIPYDRLLWLLDEVGFKIDKKIKIKLNKNLNIYKKFNIFKYYWKSFIRKFFWKTYIYKISKN